MPHNPYKEIREEWGGWKIVSNMLDNPDENGIYPTSECYRKLFEFVVSQKMKLLSQLAKEIESKKKQDTNFAPHSRYNWEKSGFNNGLDVALSLVEDRMKEGNK